MILKDKTIGVVGGGVVGHATARCWIEHVKEVRVYDVDPKKATHSLANVLQADYIYICLPTPSHADGSCDTTVIAKFFSTLHHWPIGGLLILRSTVPVGTTRMLQNLYPYPLVYNPEFLTARCSVRDAQLPARNIIGNPGYHIFRATIPLILDLYAARFPHVPCLLMSSDEAEAVKLIQNSFFAVKVAFWNEVRVFADAYKLDWSTILGAILADGRISPSHTNVPGPDGRYGFGGECLPKDLANLKSLLGANGVVCGAALERNKVDRMR